MSQKSTKHSAEQHEETAESSQPSGADLLKAVERIVSSPEEIEAQTEALVQEIRQKLPTDASGVQVRELTAQKLIARYANRAAVAGGAASAPALIPGFGTMTAFVGGGLVDMTLCLKYEIEMVLALSSLWGFDIRDPRERQLAYLLAASHTYESTPGSVPIVDFLKIELDAIWHYTPRQLSKLVATLFVKLALIYSSKGLIRAVPFVGMLVSGSLNKALAHRLGKSIVRMFELRPVPCAQEESEDAPEPRTPTGARGSKPKAPRKKKAGTSTAR